MTDPWYPPRGRYYVPSGESSEYPLRQGDLVGPVYIGGSRTPIVQVVHPTCELRKSSVHLVQVCVVEPLSVLPGDFERARVVAGMSEKDGRLLVAYAHTFYLPSVPSPGEGAFSDFRRLYLVNHEEVTRSSRLAALTHDCRVFFIRRWLYFRFRILLSVDQVYALEGERIKADPRFQGPRPPWAS